MTEERQNKKQKLPQIWFLCNNDKWNVSSSDQLPQNSNELVIADLDEEYFEILLSKLKETHPRKITIGPVKSLSNYKISDIFKESPFIRSIDLKNYLCSGIRFEIGLFELIRMKNISEVSISEELFNESERIALNLFLADAKIRKLDLIVRPSHLKLYLNSLLSNKHIRRLSVSTNVYGLGIDAIYISNFIPLSDILKIIRETKSIEVLEFNFPKIVINKKTPETIIVEELEFNYSLVSIWMTEVDFQFPFSCTETKKIDCRYLDRNKAFINLSGDKLENIWAMKSDTNFFFK